MGKKLSRALPPAIARLAAASAETIFRRTLMMARGRCPPAEYRRMVAEKAAAMRVSMLALMTGRSQTAVLAPFLSRAAANAKRIRRTA